MQNLQIIGNIGQDAVVTNHNAASFVSFRVAVSEKFTSNGQMQESTTWYSITWNRPESKLLPFLKKGTKVFVAGKPRYSMYDSAVHRCKMLDVQIMANTIELCGGDRAQPADDQQPADKPEQPESNTNPEAVPF